MERNIPGLIHCSHQVSKKNMYTHEKGSKPVVGSTTVFKKMMTNTLLKHTYSYMSLRVTVTNSLWGDGAECIDTTDKLNSHITDYMPKWGLSLIASD